jgi:hypothetical protein
MSNRFSTVLAARQALVSQTVTSTTAVSGTGVDVTVFLGMLYVTVNAPVASSGDTLAIAVEHSETLASGYSAVPADALLNDTGAPATFTTVTDAVAVFQTLSLKLERVRKYVRITVTATGASISIPVSAVFFGELKDFNL